MSVIILVLSIFLLSICPAEDCFNGIDDDGDGQIDLNDNDCKCSSNATPSDANLIFNGGFEELANTPECQGCISLFNSDNCPLGWIQESINLHTPCFLSANPSQNIGHISSNSNYQGMGGLGLDNNQERIQDEFLQTTLLSTLEIGHTYIFRGEFELPSTSIPGINIAQSHRIVLLGSVNNNQPINSSGSGCYENRPNWELLGTIDVQNNPQDIFNPFEISFIANSPITEIAIASACCQPDAPSEERLSYFGIDNLSLLPATPSPLETTISIIDNGCNAPLILCTPPENDHSYQWFINGIAIADGTQNCQQLTANIPDQTQIQLWVRSENNCTILDTTLIRNCPINQEICNNSLDDDGDGLIDYFDTDCTCEGNEIPLLITEDYCPTNIRLEIENNNQIVQWYSNNTLITETTGNILQLDSSSNLIAEYYAVITDQNGNCRISQIFSPEIPEPLNFSWTNEVASCIGNNDAIITISFTATDTNNYQFIWRNSNGETIANTPNLTNISDGNYQLNLITNTGCQGIFEFNIPPPTPAFIQSFVNYDSCHLTEAGGLINLTSIGLEEPLQHCYFDSQNSMDSICSFNNRIWLTNGIYNGITQDINGCQIEWEAIEITGSPPPQISLTANSTNLQLGEMTTLSVSGANNNIIWEPAELFDCQNCNNPQIRPIENTWVSATIFEDGCTLIDSILLIISEQVQIFAPNAFSPNFDGINDVWQLFPSEAITGFSPLFIYDRWGNLVFSGDAITGWDGTTQSGKHAPASLYIFSTTASLINGKKIPISGEIILLK